MSSGTRGDLLRIVTTHAVLLAATTAVLLMTIPETIAATIIPEPIAAPTHPCNGMGRRFCSRAHTFDKECPIACRPENCQNMEPTLVANSQGPIPGFEGVFTWEDIALDGKYDYVYTDGPWMCMATCWLEPWKATCADPEPWQGRMYCKALDCAHDHASQMRFSGCHADRAGTRKRSWHKPTCAECASVFPSACGADISDYMEAERLAEQIRIKEAHALEVAGREYCRRQYLSSVAEDISLSSSSFASESSESSSSISESSGSVNSGSSGSSSFGLDWIDMADDMKEEMRLMRAMETVGRIHCPPVQCFTDRDEIVQAYHIKSEIWYESTNEGFCVANAVKCKNGMTNNNILANAWCGASLGNCMMCWGTWCPPPSYLSHWKPVERSSLNNPQMGYKDSSVHSSIADAKDGFASQQTATAYFDRSMCASASVGVKRPGDQKQGLRWTDEKMDSLQHSGSSMTDLYINSADDGSAAGHNKNATDFRPDSLQDLKLPNSAQNASAARKTDSSDESAVGAVVTPAVLAIFQVAEDEQSLIVSSWLRAAISALSDIIQINIISSGGSWIENNSGERYSTVMFVIISPEGKLQDLANHLEGKSEDNLHEVLSIVANVTYLYASFSAQIIPVVKSKLELHKAGVTAASHDVQGTVNWLLGFAAAEESSVMVPRRHDISNVESTTPSWRSSMYHVLLPLAAAALIICCAVAEQIQ